VGVERLRDDLVIRLAVGVGQAVGDAATDREFDRLVVKIPRVRSASHQSSVDIPQNKVHPSIVPESWASRILAMPDVLVVVHDVDDNLNELAVPLAEAGLRLVTWDAQNDFEHAPTVNDLARYSGFISLGAHAGVQDEAKHPWMQLERTLIERALETELPFLGLCFGAQLLAAVAGGEFIPSPVPELGWTRVRMTAEAATDPVLGAIGVGADGMADGFHFHYDSYRLPETATLLGETDGIIQAFRVGTSAWATQFHLEVGLNQQLAWLTTYRRTFEKEGVDIEHEIDQSHALWRSYRDQAHRVAAAFAVQVSEYAQRQKN
jgi:GMP synthase (glutamine-hydrolysing)